MRTKSLIFANKPILLIVIIGFALAVLTGCGIGHGPYRHGYEGHQYYRSGYGYRKDTSNPPPLFNPVGRGYARPTIGYGDSRGVYCGW